MTLTRVHFRLVCVWFVFAAPQTGELRNEIMVMSQLNHPNICRLLEIYESPTRSDWRGSSLLLLLLFMIYVSRCRVCVGVWIGRVDWELS